MRRYDQSTVDDGTRARMVEAEGGYWVWHSEHADRVLEVLRREQAALDAAAALRAEIEALKAEIRRLGNVIGEMCE